MAKIKGNNVRVYLGVDLLMHTDSVSFNFNTGSENVTDAESGNWDENLPTTNNWTIDADFWINNSVASGADFNDCMDAWLNQTTLTVTAKLETGTEWSGLAFITSLVPSGGTAAAYVKASVSFQGTGEIS